MSRSNILFDFTTLSNHYKHLGYIWIDGKECNRVEWNGVVTNYILLFGFVKNEWSGIEYDGTHFIPYHSILHIFFSSNLGCMQ
jgi:hypothetical protein